MSSGSNWASSSHKNGLVRRSLGVCLTHRSEENNKVGSGSDRMCIEREVYSCNRGAVDMEIILVDLCRMVLRTYLCHWR